MLMKSVVALGCLALASVVASPGTDRQIDELFELTLVQDLFQVGQTEGFKAGLEMSPVALPAEKRQKILEQGKKILEEVMPWSVVRADFIEMYKAHFTEEEIEQVLELCRDPRYAVLVRKQLEMVGPSMAIGQKYSQKMMPRMMEETMRIMQEP